MKKLLIIAVFAVFSATSAMSATFSPSIGVSANTAGFAASGSEKNFDDSDALRATTKEHGAFADSFGSIFLEVNLGDTFAVGVDYVVGSFETPTNTSKEGTKPQAAFPDPGLQKVHVSFEDYTTGYIKLNLPILSGTYLKAGMSSADVIVNEETVSGNTYNNTTTEGITVGFGYNHEVSNGISVRAEIMATEWDDMTSKNNITAGDTGANSSAGGKSKNEITITDAWSARGTISIVKTF